MDQERKQLPWDPNTTQPVQRVSNYVRKRQEREFDPVAMKFRNPEKEAQIEFQRTTQLNNRISRVEEIKAKSFNIISHEGPPRRIDSLPSLIKDHSAQRSYHMLSNMPKPLHQDAPTLYDEKFILTVHKETYTHPATKSSHRNRREFNIVSNEYFENPVEKKREEYEKLKSHVLQKYWQTHDFDIVKGRYCSPEKEERYQDQMKIMQEVHGRSLERTLPPGVEYADGHSFNIVTHEVFDDTRLQAAMTMEQRQLNRVKKRQVEAAQRAAGEKQYDANETRRMMRISRQKYDSALDSGFHPLTHEKLPTDRPQPLPERPPTMWARITMHPSSSYDAQKEEFHHSRIPSAALPGTMATSSGRVNSGMGTYRDLSGGQEQKTAVGAPQYHNQSSGPVADTSYLKSHSHNNSTQTLGQRSSKIPSLDISRADFGEPVMYHEPSQKAPPGAAVSMIRTGGLSSYR
jgi:hypothetical protein